MENLFSSWREFKKGKSKRKDVLEFEFNLEDNIFQLYQELKNKTYKHSGYTSFRINDPKPRYIHKAKVRDRIIHHLISKHLNNIYDKIFIYDSYSCRINKGTHKAVNRLRTFSLKQSQNNKFNFYCLKCDIKKFFDSVDHDVLIKILKERIKDNDILRLIKEIIFSFNSETNKGIPLGNLTSQYFANIYLNKLDQFVKHKLKIKHYLRYTDDFVILDKNKDKLQKLINPINQFLNDQLNLCFYPDKIIIRKYSQGIDFLGYVTLPYYRVLRTKTKKRMFERINNKNIQSYLGVLSHCSGHKLKIKLLKNFKHDKNRGDYIEIS
ncbi:reverse transcriptase/maturase family protein [Patescibacteria group bacterium]|nr:reverse transcriptase/maturase family protein [Patescibacteria group bacterium]MBU4458683.1 reverse transcriptase/maturase family protein [Patescibacteria group bacterium]MCG2696278.1 reverse transcriptase/maturase family protein [Candidatus Portnoybacteria bacterium]